MRNIKCNLLDAKDTLSEENVTAGHIDVVVCWVSGVDHESVDELHGLGSLSSKLAGHDNLATLCSGLHDETENTVASPGNKLSLIMNTHRPECFRNLRLLSKELKNLGYNYSR